VTQPPSSHDKYEEDRRRAVAEVAAEVARIEEAAPSPLRRAGSDRFGNTPHLNAALAVVQKAIGEAEIKRDRHVEIIPKDPKKDPYSYSYATLASLTNLALPLLGANGLSFVCMPGMGTDGKGLSLKYSLRHESGETITGEWPVGGAEDLRTLGGRLTYLRRYILSALLGLAAEEDDDAMAAMIGDGQDSGGSSVRASASGRRSTASASRPAARRANQSAADNLPGSDAVPRAMLNHMFGLLGQIIPKTGDDATDRQTRLSWVSDIVNREVTSSNDLTRDETQQVIDAAQHEIDQLPTEGGQPDAG
jgi:hypothetical protein